MNNLDKSEITQYLKSIVDLESSVYRQERIVDVAKRNLVKKEVRKNNSIPFYKPVCPQRPERKEFLLEMPKEPKPYVDKSDKISELIFFCATIIFGLLLWQFAGSSFFIVCFFAFLMVVSLFLFIIFAITNNTDRKINKNIKNEYEKKLEEYNKQLEIYESNKENYDMQYQRQLDSYSRELQKYEMDYNDYQKKCTSYKNIKKKEYEEALKIADKNFEIASAEYKMLCYTLEDTKNNLDELYNMGIIFPKYCNYVAVCSMYEYFSSGRVDTLEGANGAYNLYENEIRQNLIISSLEKISTNLEVIKSNQYILYTELKENNERLDATLDEISNSIKSSLNCITRIEDINMSIAESTYINAYCSKINAENTRVMATMSFIS